MQNFLTLISLPRSLSKTWARIWLASKSLILVIIFTTSVRDTLSVSGTVFAAGSAQSPVWRDSTLLRFSRNGKSAAQQQPALFSFRKQKPALTLPCQCWLSSAVLRFIFRFRLSRYFLLTFHLLSYHKTYTKFSQLLYYFY